MQMVGSSDGDRLLSVLVRPTSSYESRAGEIRKKMLIFEQIIFFKNEPLIGKGLVLQESSKGGEKTWGTYISQELCL